LNLVVTNVPGPQYPLYLMGSRLVEAFPIVPLAQPHDRGRDPLVRRHVALRSVGRPRACEDLEVLAAGIDDAFGDC
jgi:hypothetical protein